MSCYNFVSFTGIMDEGLFLQFNKIANSILHSKSKEQRILDCQSNANTKQISENGCEVKTKCCKPAECLLESASPAIKVKALQVNKIIFFKQHPRFFSMLP